MRRIVRRHKQGRQAMALFTDIDDTFYRSGYDLVVKKLYEIIIQNNWIFVYVTGRSFHSVIQTRDLPLADIIVSSLGTEIHIKKNNGQYLLDTVFDRTFQSNWDVERIDREVISLMSAFSGLKFQPEYEPANRTGFERYRVSLHYFGRSKDAKLICRLIKSKLKNIHPVLSRDLENEEKFDIDLLPMGVNYGYGKKRYGKIMAMNYLIGQLGLFGIIAGNSQHDRDMIWLAGLPGVIVGNSNCELLAEAKALPKIVGKIFLLPNGRKLYVGDQNDDIGPKAILNALADDKFNQIDLEQIRKAIKG